MGLLSFNFRVLSLTMSAWERFLLQEPSRLDSHVKAGASLEDLLQDPDIFLDRVQRKRGDSAIVLWNDRPVFTGPRTAKTGLALTDFAMPETNITLCHFHT